MAFNAVDSKGTIIAEGFETEADAEMFIDGQLPAKMVAKVVEASDDEFEA